jgi:hypothetical protein
VFKKLLRRKKKFVGIKRIIHAAIIQYLNYSLPLFISLMNTQQHSESTKDNFVIKPMTLTQLAEIYSVSKTTFRKWLSPVKDKIERKQGVYFSIEQVKFIIEHLGFPEKINEK